MSILYMNKGEHEKSKIIQVISHLGERYSDTMEIFNSLLKVTPLTSISTFKELLTVIFITNISKCSIAMYISIPLLFELNRINPIVFPPIGTNQEVDITSCLQVVQHYTYLKQ